MTPIPAIYEHGVLKLLRRVNLPDHQRVLIALFPAQDDIPSFLIGEAAIQAQSFDFLDDPAEDLYRPTDGEPV
jgi:predicted DNA-binding antitoxin AbrB/MazE fold protein